MSCCLRAQAAPAQAEALARLRDANVLGLQFGAAGPVVSVLVSKAGARYRVQSDCFHAMWLVVQVGAWWSPGDLLHAIQRLGATCIAHRAGPLCSKQAESTALVECI